MIYVTVATVFHLYSVHKLLMHISVVEIILIIYDFCPLTFTDILMRPSLLYNTNDAKCDETDRSQLLQQTVKYAENH